MKGFIQTMEKVPTKEQENIINCTGNCVVTAKPGSGKTYTVVKMIDKIANSLPDYKGVIAISFTNKASDELKKRCRTMGIPSAQSFYGTIDKFYITQIIIPFASHLTNNLPDYQVCENISDDATYGDLINLSLTPTPSQEDLLIAALREGKIFLEKSGETAMFILRTVPAAIKYIKAKYSHIFVDEYQDCGDVQHKIFLYLVGAGLTGVAVGDINQAIYGFAKRFPKYLIDLIGNKDFEHYELSKNHRCHPGISEYSLALFGASKEIPEEKRVFLVRVSGNEPEIAKRIDSNLKMIKEKYNVRHNNQIAILCRSNSTAQILDRVLQTKHKNYVETSLDNDSSEWGRLFKDILVAQFTPSTYAVDFAEQLFSEETEGEKYRKALSLLHGIFSRTPEDLLTVEDAYIALAEMVYPKKRNEAAVAKLHNVLSSADLIHSYIPAAENEVNIMTIHKSKGLEFNIVFHMDMYKYILSDEWDKKEDIEQMLNLHYVGVTRAIDVCYIMNGSLRYRAKYNDYYSAYPSSFLALPGLTERRRDVCW